MATWYSSGWNVWKLLASTSVTSTGAPSRPRAAARPPKPAPTTTTCGVAQDGRGATSHPHSRIRPMAVVGEHHPAFEEYCECIFELAEDDVDVIQARIAERLNVSRPAVSEMMRRLESEGLIDTTAGIRLTDAGQHLATTVVRRHRLAERFLTDVLNLSWAEAHHEAGKWEHVMSDHVEQAMDRLLGSPTTCPHGNPIPGSAYVETDSRPLADVACRRGVHRPADHRRARVHARPARVPRGQRAATGQRRHDHRGVARRHRHGRDRRPPRRRRRLRQRPHPGQCVTRSVRARRTRPDGS